MNRHRAKVSSGKGEKQEPYLHGDVQIIELPLESIEVCALQQGAVLAQDEERVLVAGRRVSQQECGVYVCVCVGGEEGSRGGQR